MSRHQAHRADRADAAPRRLPGFEHIHRYWDRDHDTFAVKIRPGEYYVSQHNEMIVTVLGSCVSACIRDSVLGIGGMNHFMLPASGNDDTKDWGSGSLGAATRYGHYAMEQLINDILKHGGSREHLEVKIFGGGRIMAQMTDIGRHNIAFVRAYIEAEGLRLVAEDVGNTYPRKILYFPANGRVRRKRLPSLHTDLVVQRETRYLGHLSRPTAGDIELFE